MLAVITLVLEVEDNEQADAYAEELEAHCEMSGWTLLQYGYRFEAGDADEEELADALNEEHEEREMELHLVEGE